MQSFSLKYSGLSSSYNYTAAYSYNYTVALRLHSFMQWICACAVHNTGTCICACAVAAYAVIQQLIGYNSKINYRVLKLYNSYTVIEDEKHSYTVIENISTYSQ